MARNPEFERKHPRDAEGQFTEKAGGSAPRWMQDLDAKIEAEQKRRDAARQPGHVPERRSELQQFLAAASSPSDRDVRGPGQPVYGQGLSVESARPRPQGMPQRTPANNAIRQSVGAMVRDAGLRVDQVVGIGLQGVMARMAQNEFPLEQLPAEVDLFAIKTNARHKEIDAHLLRQLAKDLDQVINGTRREGLAEQFSPDRVFNNRGWGRPPTQHPGALYPPSDSRVAYPAMKWTGERYA